MHLLASMTPLLRLWRPPCISIVKASPLIPGSRFHAPCSPELLVRRVVGDGTESRPLLSQVRGGRSVGLG